MPKLLSRTLKAIGIYLAAQQGFAAYWLFQHSRNVPQRVRSYQNEAEKGTQLDEFTEHNTYTVRHSIIDGIERVVYTPKNRQFETPIVMQHGMWHGAWCWAPWQRLFAEWGWETHAHSLPGHARSATQRPVWLCTLDYYLAFYKAEIDKMPRKPIIMGHSMGGALAQWYLKYIGQDLPAAVLVAPWVAHSALLDGVPLLLRHDPMAILLTMLQWNANGWVRSPHWAAQKLTSEGALLSPEELYERLTAESVLATMQHNPPFWSPARDVQLPMLVLAGAYDRVVSVEGLRQSAKHYGADFQIIPQAAHNLMLEHNHESTARLVHEWLLQQVGA